MSLEESLSSIEQLIEKVSTALLAANPQSLEQSSTALRDAAAQLAQSLEQTTARRLLLTPDVKQRLSRVSAALSLHRDSLARLLASTDRQAASILPVMDATAAVTYSDDLGARSNKPGVARLYRSVS